MANNELNDINNFSLQGNILSTLTLVILDFKDVWCFKGARYGAEKGMLTLLLAPTSFFPTTSLINLYPSYL